MRKALVIGVVGLFMASSAAVACPWSSKSASSGQQQTVMTDQVKPTGSGG